MFSKQWPTGLTNDNSTVDATKLAQLDTNVSRALDGSAGGTYQPTADLVIDASLGGGLSASLLKATGLLYLTSSTIAQIVANQNDWATPNGKLVCRISADAARDVTGIAGVSADRVLILINVGGFAITLKHENAGSTAVNRFKFAAAADKIVGVEGIAILFYDGTTTRWRALV